MPTYGYRCQQCASEFDVLQRMSDAPEASCPACGGAGKRLFFPAGIVFKGSGFYKTDSRSPAAAANRSGKADEGTKGAPAPAAATDVAGAGDGTSTAPAAPAETVSKPATATPKPPASTTP